MKQVRIHIKSFQSGILAVALGMEPGLVEVFFNTGAEDVREGTVVVGAGLETVPVGLDTTGVADAPMLGELETPGAGGEIAGVGVEAVGCGVDATGTLVNVDGWSLVLTGITRGFVAGGLLNKFDKIPGTAAMPLDRRSSRGFF